MDIEKIKVREELNHLVWNYYLLGKIPRGTADRIMAYNNILIGGGEREGRVIMFPQRDKPLEKIKPKSNCK